jgi:hypothetical protein
MKILPDEQLPVKLKPRWESIFMCEFGAGNTVSGLGFGDGN